MTNYFVDIEIDTRREKKEGRIVTGTNGLKKVLEAERFDK